MAKSVVRVDGVRFTYQGGAAPAVTDLAFEIPAGEIFGFLGPSGAGKSTTQKLLIGLLTGYEGRIAVFGRDLGEWSSDYYERLGVSFEFPNHHLKLTALENLDYFRSLYTGPTEDPRTVLAQVGLEADRDKRVAEFSKGMRGRLNVARALLSKPELLFLDEPTAGLDPVTSRSIRELIRERREVGATVFLTTHDMVVADELCDRVAFIVDGRLALVDAPRALKLEHGRRTVRVELDGPDGRSVSEHALDGLGSDPGFLQALRSGRVQTIHTQETTLEEIFVRVTGSALS